KCKDMFGNGSFLRRPKRFKLGTTTTTRTDSEELSDYGQHLSHTDFSSSYDHNTFFYNTKTKPEFEQNNNTDDYGTYNHSNDYLSEFTHGNIHCPQDFHGLWPSSNFINNGRTSTTITVNDCPSLKSSTPVFPLCYPPSISSVNETFYCNNNIMPTITPDDNLQLSPYFTSNF
ncbi:unnamed protein product, partial [Didymodactylos carnosus]